MKKFTMLTVALIFLNAVGCADPDSLTGDNGDTATYEYPDDSTQIYPDDYIYPVDITPIIAVPLVDNEPIEVDTPPPPSWQPSDVNLTCASGHCPSGVGAVIFVQNLADRMVMARCTATLIAPNQVMTNAHCDQGGSFVPDQGYFFALENGVTMVYPLGPKVYDRLDYPYDSPNSGFGGDLAIFSLSRPDYISAPRAISRQIPADMSQLVGYMVNDLDGNPNDPSTQFRTLTIDSVQCATTKTDDEMTGGVNDLSTNLDLFACQLSSSVSGAPFFAAGNTRDVQVVGTASGFFGRLPSGPAQFGTGNRVQCMDIPGLKAPDQLCQPWIPPARDLTQRD